MKLKNKFKQICILQPPATLHWKKKRPQNGQQGLEMCLPLGFWALRSTFANNRFFDCAEFWNLFFGYIFGRKKIIHFPGWGPLPSPPLDIFDLVYTFIYPQGVPHLWNKFSKILFEKSLSEKRKIHEKVVTDFLEFIGFMVFKMTVLISRLTSFNDLENSTPYFCRFFCFFHFILPISPPPLFFSSSP